MLQTIEAWTSILADLATGGSLVVAAYFGVRGLNEWRRQLIGTRKLEAAEQALVAAHEALSALRAVRSPLGFVGEAEGATDSRGEILTGTRQGYYVPVARMRKNSEIFSKLWASQLRCKVLFGDEADRHFNAFLDAQKDIAIASRMLVETRREDGIDEESRALIRKWRETIWDVSTDGSPDRITKSLNDAITGLEGLFRPHLR